MKLTKEQQQHIAERIIGYFCRMYRKGNIIAVIDDFSTENYDIEDDVEIHRIIRTMEERISTIAWSDEE